MHQIHNKKLVKWVYKRKFKQQKKNWKEKECLVVVKAAKKGFNGQIFQSLKYACTLFGCQEIVVSNRVGEDIKIRKKTFMPQGKLIFASDYNSIWQNWRMILGSNFLSQCYYLSTSLGFSGT